MSLLEDVYKAVIENTKYSSAVLGALWQFIQQREADKTPDEWVPTYAIVGDTNCNQILGHNKNRASLTIVNNGPGVAIICNRQMDAAEGRAIINGVNTGGVTQMYQLKSGLNVTIGTRGAVYAFCLTTASVAELDCVETVYGSATGPREGHHAHFPGLAAMMEQGLPLDANQEDRVTGRVLR